MSCTCPRPAVAADPRHTSCLRCCKAIDGGPGISTDESFEKFFHRLEDGIFPLRVPPEKRGFFRSVKALCKSREKAGRAKFGLDYLSHDGIGNAAEEAADFLVYLYLRDQRTYRETGEHANIEVLLEASKLAIEALEMASQYPAKRRGAP